jgi:hypothetical protein
MAAAVDPNPGFIKNPLGGFMKCGNAVNQGGAVWLPPFRSNKNRLLKK